MQNQKTEEIYTRLCSFWDALSAQQRELVHSNVRKETFKKGEVVRRDDERCKGALLVTKGQIRIYIMSDKGREITLFRLEEGEICMLSASCVLDCVSFDVLIDAAQDTQVYVLPGWVLKQLKEENQQVELAMLRAANRRFGEVLRQVNRMLFMGVDERISTFLLSEADARDTQVLHLTHEEIARNVGSVREVVSRFMEHLEKAQIVKLGRGEVCILDRKALEQSGASKS